MTCRKTWGYRCSIREHRIQSLDSSGFTVGTTAQVNGAGVTYFWVAWKAGPGEMTVGTYTGNGGGE